MVDCKKCKYKGVCSLQDLPNFDKNKLKKCKIYEKKEPQTNADMVRSMNDEELAEFLGEVFNNLFTRYTFLCEHCSERTMCHECFKIWLKKEVSEE